MQTPFGKECRYFYGDYYRGRSHEECRLLESAGLEWSAYLCQKCPIPDILMANACKHMQFHPKLVRPLIVMKRQVEISTYCSKSQNTVNEPRVGCGQCHPILDIFEVSPDDPDTAV
jgi:hypothetical protein